MRVSLLVMRTTRHLLDEINLRLATTFVLQDRYATGEQGAYALADVTGDRFVLKWAPDCSVLTRYQHITDKEAGMLSMEAYLSLYDSTQEPRWLERAKAAADFAESWIWIWKVLCRWMWTTRNSIGKRACRRLGFRE